MGTKGAPTRMTGASSLVQDLLGDGGRDLGPDAKRFHGLVGDHEPVGFADGVEHRLLVPGLDRHQVDDLHADAVVLEVGSRAERLVDETRHGDDGHVGALPLDVGLAQGDQMIRPLGDLALHGVQRLVLDEDDGVVVADRRLEEALDVVRVGGHNDFNPGTWANHASRHCECWGPALNPAPSGILTTMGMVYWLPNMYRILAIWFTILSMAQVTKSMNMISTTGRRPQEAAPAAMEVRLASLMGVSTTRSGPNFLRRSRLAPKDPPACPTSSPMRKTRSSLSISSSRASLMAKIYRMSFMSELSLKKD